MVDNPARTLIETDTPGGRKVRLWVREQTNDLSVVYSITAANDEYRLKGRTLIGWAMDVGSHIGTAAVVMALDNPGLRVLAVEPVPENVAMIEANAAENGVADRITVVPFAAGIPGIGQARCSYGYRETPSDDPDYTRNHRYIGNQYRSLADPEHDLLVPSWGLRELLVRHGVAGLSFMKIDCEGCEYAVLDSPAVARVSVIIGEYHSGYADEPETYTPGAPKRIRELLEATHDVRMLSDDPVVGLFEAVLR